jgi:hypothetical protein
VLSEPLRQYCPAIGVHLELFAFTEIDEFKGLAECRARGLPPNDTFNLFDQTRTASFNRVDVEMGVAVDVVSTFLGEDRTEWRRDGDTSPWVDLAFKA